MARMPNADGERRGGHRPEETREQTVDESQCDGDNGDRLAASSAPSAVWLAESGAKKKLARIFSVGRPALTPGDLRRRPPSRS